MSGARRQPLAVAPRQPYIVCLMPRSGLHASVSVPAAACLCGVSGLFIEENLLLTIFLITWVDY